MRVGHHGLLAILLMILSSTGAWAQGQDCELLPGAREASRRIVGREEILYISGPARFVCPGDVILEADSAVGLRSLGEVELIGNVFFQDSAKTLTAAWARYLRDDARLLARDDVVLTDRRSRSTIEGPELEYLLAGDLRPESEAIIQGRPHATFYREPEEGGEGAGEVVADSVAEPFEVDADIMRIYDDTRIIALGRVEMTQAGSRGFAREGEFDQEGGMMLLRGEARLEGEGYDLDGELIEAILVEERLQRVVSTGDASLRTEDLDLESHELRIYFEDDEINRLIAIGPREESPEPGTISATEGDPEPVDRAEELARPQPLSTQPVVTSPEFRLAADSIDVHAPGQELEVVIAVGRASGIRAPDSLDRHLPELISRDWMVGDTITGYFVKEVRDDEERAPDPELAGLEGRELEDGEPKARVALERLVAVGEGGAARSLYRIRKKGEEGEPPSANYLVANRITLTMREGEVQDVEADGPIEGILLQPAGRDRDDSDDRDDASAELSAGT